MLIILEGLNGVGKTTYSERIEERLGIKTIRPFKDDLSIHWSNEDGGYMEFMRERIGVPINSHIDYMYMTELARILKFNAVFDRSPVSSIAYGNVYGSNSQYFPHNDNRRNLELLVFWTKRLSMVDNVSFFWLKADYEDVKQRCSGRWHPNKKDYSKLEKLFTKMFNGLKIKKKKIINTSQIDVHSGISLIANTI